MWEYLAENEEPYIVPDIHKIGKEDVDIYASMFFFLNVLLTQGEKRQMWRNGHFVIIIIQRNTTRVE